MKLVKVWIFLLIAAAPAAFFSSCSNNNDLDEVKVLVEQKEYQQAITKLDKILSQDPENKEAKLLKIRASMLLKSMQRTPEPKDQNNKPEQESSLSAGQERNIKVSKTSSERGFSIMSLSGGKDDLSEITKKLSTN